MANIQTVGGGFFKGDCPVCGGEWGPHSSPFGQFTRTCTRCGQRIYQNDAGFPAWQLLEPFSLLLHDRSGDRSLLLDLVAVNDEMVRHLATHPELLHDISPRKFEELVAELLKGMGYDVELRRYSRDGGWDISAIWRSDIGLFLTLVECKRFRPDRPVGVEHVEKLIGVRDYQKASSAMIATTSSFTSGAEHMAQDYRWQLSLRDYENMTDWLSREAARRGR